MSSMDGPGAGVVADSDAESERLVPRRAKDDVKAELPAPPITDAIFHAWIQHGVGESRPEVPRLIVPDIEPTEIDEAIAVRLLAAYRACLRAEAEEGGVGPDLWSAIRTLQESFFDILDAGDARALAAYLCNMSRHDATIGLTQGNEEHRWIVSSHEFQDFRALLIKDRLVSFAEAVGAVQSECPEVGPWGRHMHADFDELVAAVERQVGVSLAPPEIDGGLLKVPASDGAFHDRDLHAQFAAWSMLQILGPGATVCEIGGGVGRAAYWARRFGLGAYVLLDLPHVNLLQGYYLLKSLPADAVRLFGEEVEAAQVTVWPYFAKRRMPRGSIDMVFNQDSLPEIHRDAALDYVRWAREVGARWLYSINQESAEAYSQRFWEPAEDGDPRQNVVSELVGEGGGFRRLVRVPYGLRRGYMAELYRLAPAS